MDQAAKRRILAQARRNCEPINFEPRPDANEVRYTQPPERAELLKQRSAGDDDLGHALLERQSWGRWLIDRLDYERNVILQAAGEGIRELLDEESVKWRKDIDALRSQVSKLEVECARATADVARLRMEHCELARDKAIDLPAWPKREPKAVN